jgi:hypothetical protein
MKFIRFFTNTCSRVPCERCIYYVPRDFPFTPNVGRCRLFGEQDPDTKEVTYYYSELCRNEEHKCGKNGKYFIKS